MAVQNIVPVNEMPTLVNEVVTVTTSETDNIPIPNATVPLITDNGSILNVSNTQEVITSENEKKTIDVQVAQPIVLPTPSVPIITATTTPPKIVHAPNNQFVQVKPPTTTSGRIQSPNVKNFFIRKGIEKQPPLNQPIVSSPSTGTFITTQATHSHVSVSQLPANKKIIIKSQQIIVPANNIKQNAGQIIQMSGGQPVNVSAASTPVTINANVIESSPGDLSGILDLPILFADNTSEATVQSGQIINTTTSSNILLTTAANDRIAHIGSPPTTSISNISNFFINAPDGKLPNRPVVISAAKITKPLQQQSTMSTIATTPTPTSNKLIFINRNQIKQQIVGTPTTSGHHTQIVKGLPTLKLMPTSLASSSTTSTPITLQRNQITKLSPGTKIDLSTLKFVKNTTPIQGILPIKPLIINKAVPGTKNAILIKSPMAQPVIKGNLGNRNITVRKVMNVVPSVKQVANSPVTISNVNVSTSSSPTMAATQSIITNVNVSPTTAPTSNTAILTAASPSPSPSASPPKTTRKTRNSN